MDERDERGRRMLELRLNQRQRERERNEVLSWDTKDEYSE